MDRIRPIETRRDALVAATIAEVARKGSLDVTVAQIARRAGMSSALAHHYFGTKDDIFLQAMRHILVAYGRDVRAELRAAATPRDRIDAILRASFASAHYRPEVIAAWLTFYATARTSPGAARLLAIYRGRLRSNLGHALRPWVGAAARREAETLAALIDGFYLRDATRPAGSGPHADADRAPEGAAALEAVRTWVRRLDRSGTAAG